VTSESGTGSKPGNSKWRARLARYGPLVFWMGLIFFFSSGEASAVQTSRIIRPVLEFLFPSASEATLIQYHFYIRKAAHLTEYALLAFFAIRAFARSSYVFLRNYRFLTAVVLVLVVASLDELNQSFEPSRTSTVRDVGLDLVGGATMAILLKLISLRQTRSGRATNALTAKLFRLWQLCVIFYRY
jgi:VanZ family protein